MLIQQFRSLFSKMESQIKIFVYGTLKTNEPNHQHMVEKGAKFLCKGTTVKQWPLVIYSERNVPFLLNTNSCGKVIIQFGQPVSSFI